MNSAGFVETENLTKVYSSGKIHVVALKDVNLSVEEEKFMPLCQNCSCLLRKDKLDDIEDRWINEKDKSKHFY